MGSLGFHGIWFEVNLILERIELFVIYIFVYVTLNKIFTKQYVFLFQYL